MAVHKLALLRYKTIDDCLRNRFRKWTLEDLIEKVAEVLYDKEGISSGVSRRTIQADIQVMRSDQLGYNAPIVVTDRKYYCYSEKDYSITNAPISNADVDKMKEVLVLLKQFNGFSYFEDMSEMIARLEQNLRQSTHQSHSHGIHFEQNKQLKGLEHLNPLYQAILQEHSLLIEYQSFKARHSLQGIYYPYLLKEYRNRWYLICRGRKSALLTLALDRIIGFQELPNEKFQPYTGVDLERYFSDVLGVTKSEKERAHRVILQINGKQAPYVRTKPLHTSQQVLKEEADQSILIRIDVILNFELERELLGFGECLKVLAPRILASRIRKRLKESAAQYDPVEKNDG